MANPDRPISPDVPVSFRPDSEDFCEEFNLVWQLTGWSRNKFILEALRKGMGPVAEEVLAQREVLDKEYRSRWDRRAKKNPPKQPPT